MTSLDEVNDRLQLGLEDDEHNTLAGYLISRLGRLGQVGDEVRVPAGRLEVVAVKGRTIASIRYTPASRPGSTVAGAGHR
jgi:putative hemolysin